MSNIYLTGFSGSGKTTVGRQVASLLGWDFVDLDENIVKKAGKSIEDIFAQSSESEFRDIESECLVDISQNTHQVVSTGGGIVLKDSNRQLMEKTGAIICLEASPEIIFERIKNQSSDPGNSSVRPMLDASQTLDRIYDLKSERQFAYSLANWIVHTDILTQIEVAQEVVRGWKILSSRNLVKPSQSDVNLASVVNTSSGNYPVWVGWGLLDDAGELVKRTLSANVAYVVTDDGAQGHAKRVQKSLTDIGLSSHLYVMPQGERNKNLDTTRELYSWLSDLKAERGHLILSVGGGVVGDLAGFVAATFLRGIHLCQIPTTLLSMMDAAVGGKTGVDLPEGKNLVGAFYQPRLVIADVRTLQTLPARERISGWAEAIKHGHILDEELFHRFEQEKDAILSLDQQICTDVIRRSVSIKAGVVSRDEKETLGVRILLNYGHTIGHAIEASTHYDRYFHGEAVSIGMTGAALISNSLGMLSKQGVERQKILLKSFGLPVSCSGLDPLQLRQTMQMDKKKSGGEIQWVLLDEIGRAVTRNDVSRDLVDSVLKDLCR